MGKAVKGQKEFVKAAPAEEESETEMPPSSAKLTRSAVKAAKINQKSDGTTAPKSDPKLKNKAPAKETTSKPAVKASASKPAGSKTAGKTPATENSGGENSGGENSGAEEPAGEDCGPEEPAGQNSGTEELSHPLPYKKNDKTFVPTAANVREHRLFSEVIKDFDSKNPATYPPQYTLLSDEWKLRVANITGKLRGKRWPASFDSKGHVLAGDIGYGPAGILVAGDKQRFAITYGNVQLRGDVGREQWVDRIVTQSSSPEPKTDEDDEDKDREGDDEQEE